MIHPLQPLTQAIQDAPVRMTGAEAENAYVKYQHDVWKHNSSYYRFEGHDAVEVDSFAEWLTANRIRIM